MPISYSIDTEKKLIEATIHGSITVQEYYDQMAIIADDPRHNPDFDKLLDIREGSINLPTAKRHQFTKTLATLYSERKERFVVVASDPIEIAHGMLFGANMQGDNAKVFSTREAAMEWLNEPHHPFD